ncbi:hypothetical protein MMYC01_207422 [Madurella mycetomatis]|uniref:Uncharacterized protein n=1 Tax=Madurella mycetomatis TaxID=100816 RepID=A0A175VWL0_9PEZI|nr:hypothetical protein MMYC01_207422 [Madurella mycetomatis]
MAASPSPYAAISVSSGCLCFGALNNIWNGASMPVQPFPTNTGPGTSGTIIRQPIEYNIVAQNGTWNAFRLIDLEKNKVTAWFLAHSDVDPQAELDKILRVSGSPYELDSGSHLNDDKTARQGVFVINRYDWGYYYDKRSRDEVEDVEQLEREAGRVHTVFEAAGLVDLAAARPMVLRWKAQPSSERLWSEGGAWLHIPNSEYMFGRFGFDEDRVAARSFLFFTTYTVFTQTAFEGLGQTLRKKETPKERFERLLQEGFDFSGVEELNKISQPLQGPGIVQLSPQRPPLADCFGPYDPSDHIFRAQDIINIVRSREFEVMPIGGRDVAPGDTSTPISEFIEPWAESAYDVLNEMVLSYLQRTAIPRIGNRGVSAAAELLFPRHTLEDRDSRLDVLCYRKFTQPDALQIPNFDSTYLSNRIKSFLTRFGDASVAFEDECVAGITRVVAYLLAEILEVANRNARWGNVEWAKIMPSDIRTTVYFDFAIRDYLQFSRVYWEGRDRSPSTE